MNRNNFERWITSETNRALYERDLGRVRLLLSWYETKFRVEFSSLAFEYPFTNQLVAYHQIVKNQSWLNGLINEELAKSNYDGGFISVNPDWFNAGLNLDNSFIIIDPDSFCQYDNDSIIGGYLDEVNSIMQDITEPFFIHEKRNIKFASGLLSIKVVHNLISTLEDEIQGFNRVIILGEPDFVLDVIYALELSSINIRVEIVNLNHRAVLEKFMLPSEMIKSFEERYGVGNYSFRDFFPCILKGKEISVENPMISENPNVIESIAKMLTRVYRNSTSTGVVYTRSSKNVTQVVEDSISVSDENLFKEKLMFSDEEINDKMLLCLSALNTGSHVLLLGETGVGKSLIAQTFHQFSDRRDKPFLKVNCAALSKELYASELFGAVPGAFTGISRDGLKGKIEAADKGTLFLDEIFDADSAIQAKLLTFLDDHTYMKVGGYQTEKADVRIIFATNRNISVLAKQADFREDFYHRISTFQITIPPLRDRQRDIIEVFHSCLKDISRRQGVPHLTVSPQTLKMIKELRWSGNIRQLINTIYWIIRYCHRKNIKTITPDIFLKIYEEIYSPEELDNLEKQLIEFFNLWESKKDGFIKFISNKGLPVDEEKGMNYLDGFIKPIIAHFFIEKYNNNYNRKDVFKAIGMNAERQDSYLTMNAKLYPFIKEYFSK